MSGRKRGKSPSAPGSWKKKGPKNHPVPSSKKKRRSMSTLDRFHQLENDIGGIRRNGSAYQGAEGITHD
jgi:hypothetical protein